jgi:hypothetical protein
MGYTQTDDPLEVRNLLALTDAAGKPVPFPLLDALATPALKPVVADARRRQAIWQTATGDNVEGRVELTPVVQGSWAGGTYTVTWTSAFRNSGSWVPAAGAPVTPGWERAVGEAAYKPTGCSTCATLLAEQPTPVATQVGTNGKFQHALALPSVTPNTLYTLTLYSYGVEGHGTTGVVLHSVPPAP